LQDYAKTQEIISKLNLQRSAIPVRFQREVNHLEAMVLLNTDNEEEGMGKLKDNSNHP